MWIYNTRLRITKALDTLVEKGESDLILIYGEAGVGKSHILKKAGNDFANNVIIISYC